VCYRPGRSWVIWSASHCWHLSEFEEYEAIYLNRRTDKDMRTASINKAAAVLRMWGRAQSSCFQFQVPRIYCFWVTNKFVDVKIVSGLNSIKIIIMFIALHIIIIIIIIIIITVKLKEAVK
jgi:hypothetical protein